jgi:hypothetical protein
MNSLLHDFTAGILRAPEPPCLSLYQPTHRHHPDTQQDPIRFRNLVKVLEESLRQKYSSRDLRRLLRPFQELAEDYHFWNYNLDGLAVLAGPGVFHFYRLPRPVPELAVVAESFHVKPLIRILQSADRYHVLGLNRQQIKLFEGNRDALAEVEIEPGVPRTAIEVVGEEEAKEDHLSVWPSAPGGGVHYGTASTAEILDHEANRFFRAVDRAILEHYSRPLALPLILAALPENQSSFRQISRNPFLIAEGVTIHPDALSVEALRERTWQVLEPHYLKRLAGLVEMFGVVRAKELGDDDLAQIAPNAAAGRVATLLIEADRLIPGRLDGATGEIEFAELTDPNVADLLDDVAAVVLKNSGHVVIVPAERMPTQTGIAAIYRY